jgi:hypothetical protein
MYFTGNITEIDTQAITNQRSRAEIASNSTSKTTNTTQRKQNYTVELPYNKPSDTNELIHFISSLSAN